jgi:hypothetical protein
MPSHQERIRAKNPEMNCSHLFAISNSEIAPFIEENGNRTTVGRCIYCGIIKKYTRSQEQFLLELKFKSKLPFWLS